MFIDILYRLITAAKEKIERSQATAIQSNCPIDDHLKLSASESIKTSGRRKVASNTIHEHNNNNDLLISSFSSFFFFLHFYLVDHRKGNKDKREMFKVK